MRALAQYIKEGLLNTDISDLDASVMIEEFWKLAADIADGKFSVRDQTVIAKFLEYLPMVKVWAEDNSINSADRNAWGIAVKENCFVVLGNVNIYEFVVEDNKMKYSHANAIWYMGPSAKTRAEVKRQFVKTYVEDGCQVFWVDKKTISLFKK